MTRKEFIELLGATTVVTCLGCSKTSPLAPATADEEAEFFAKKIKADPHHTSPHSQEGGCPPPPQKVDFVINLSQAPYTLLQQPGTFAYYKGIIIAKTLQEEYIAVSEYCTHNGVTIEFFGAQNRFKCPAHGSAFNTNGEVINGPVQAAIKTYKTQLAGQQLRVYED